MGQFAGATTGDFLNSLADTLYSLWYYNLLARMVRLSTHSLVNFSFCIHIEEIIVLFIGLNMR